MDDSVDREKKRRSLTQNGARTTHRTRKRERQGNAALKKLSLSLFGFQTRAMRSFKGEKERKVGEWEKKMSASLIRSLFYAYGMKEERQRVRLRRKGEHCCCCCCFHRCRSFLSCCAAAVHDPENARALLLALELGHSPIDARRKRETRESLSARSFARSLHCSRSSFSIPVAVLTLCRPAHDRSTLQLGSG